MVATMEDVARRAAVSTATVSRVINHPHLVNQETRDLVMKAIEELGYRVNNSARSLRTSQTYTLAVVVDNLSNHTSVKFLEAFEDCVVKEGYSLQICLVHNDQKRVMHYLHELTQQGQVDGIIWMTTYTDPTIADKLTIHSGHNILLVDTLLPGIPLQNLRTFLLDYHTAFYKATRYLLEQGHRQIALLSLADEHHAPAQMRLRGYAKALEEYALTVEDRWIFLADEASMLAWQMTVETMLNSPELPSAVLAFDDNVAAQVYRTASTRMMVIPDQLSVIGCGDFSLSNFLEPPLSSFTMPMERLAQEAFSNLLAAEGEWVHTLFDMDFVLRASVRLC